MSGGLSFVQESVMLGCMALLHYARIPTVILDFVGALGVWVKWVAKSAYAERLG